MFLIHLQNWKGSFAAPGTIYTRFFSYRDRFRTTINVLGDAFGAGIVHYRSKKELDRATPKATEENS